MTDPKKKDDDAVPARRDGSAQPAAKDPLTIVIPEIQQAIQQQARGQLDVNILLRVVQDRALAPADALDYASKALEIAEQYEDHRYRVFQRQAEGIIELKCKDPDEIDKRQNNKIRRGLKVLLGICGVAGLGGGIACAAMGASVVVATSLVTAGGISLAMLGPLASGESVSSNDVVRIISALRTRPERQEGRGEDRQQRKKR